MPRGSASIAAPVGTNRGSRQMLPGSELPVGSVHGGPHRADLLVVGIDAPLAREQVQLEEAVRPVRRAGREHHREQTADAVGAFVECTSKMSHRQDQGTEPS